MRYLLFIICLTLLFTTNIMLAQDCSEYKRLIEQAKQAKYLNDYETSINTYYLAMQNCRDSLSSVQKELFSIFKEIQNLKDKAEQAQQKAEKEKEKVLIAQKLNEKLINLFYFYEDKIAVAHKYGKFGFINRNADIVIEFKYDKVSMFDYTGFAKVERDRTKYLIDRSGNEYPVAYSINDIIKEDAIIVKDSVLEVNSSKYAKIKATKALDLRGQEFISFPFDILKHNQLQIIMLNGSFSSKEHSYNEFDFFDGSKLWRPHSILPPVDYDVDQWSHGHRTQSVRNSITQVPQEICNLKNLSYFNIKGSDVSEEDQIVIKKLLPNCIIVW